MSKYIIDTDQFTHRFNPSCIGVYGIGKDINDMDEKVVWSRMVNIDDLDEFNSNYINEHYGDLQDTAYQKGLHDGESKCRYCNEYQRGLEDGKAVNDKGCEGCEHECENKMTQTCILCCNAYKNRWIAKSDKIEVGDEVEPFYTDITGVVTLIDGDTIYILWRDGSSTSAMKLKEVTKTGRHFDIASILEDMRK